MNFRELPLFLVLASVFLLQSLDLHSDQASNPTLVAQIESNSRPIQVGEWASVTVRIRWNKKTISPSEDRDQKQYVLKVRSQTGFDLQRSISPQNSDVQTVSIPVYLMDPYPILEFHLRSASSELAREKLRIRNVRSAREPLISPALYQTIERPIWRSSQQIWLLRTVLLLLGTVFILFTLLYWLVPERPLLQWSFVTAMPFLVFGISYLIKPPESEGVMETIQVKIQSSGGNSVRQSSFNVFFSSDTSTVSFPAGNLNQFKPVFSRNKDIQLLMPELRWKNNQWYYKWDRFPDEGYLLFRSRPASSNPDLKFKNEQNPNRIRIKNESNTSLQGLFHVRNKSISFIGQLPGGDHRALNPDQHLYVPWKTLLNSSESASKPLPDRAKTKFQQQNYRRLQHFLQSQYFQGSRRSRILLRTVQYVLEKLPQSNQYIVGIHIQSSPRARYTGNLERTIMGQIIIGVL